MAGPRSGTRTEGATKRPSILSLISPGPLKGKAPVNSSYKVTPKANTSDSLTTAPMACSGAIYTGVPTMVLVVVSSESRTCRAMPKSMTLTQPPSASITFEGFMSRWMTWRACA